MNGPPPPPKSVSDLFDERGIIKTDYNTERYLKTLERRHTKAVKIARKLEDDDYQIPVGVRYAMKLKPIWNQNCRKYPWAIYVIQDGKRKRRRVGTLGDAVALHKRMISQYPGATIVSLSRSYDIPPQLRGRLPKPWKWCPRCMKPRKFRRRYLLSGQPDTFFTLRKEWNDEKARYEWKERKLQVIECPLCMTTNRDPVYRRSNQPWEKRNFKRGVTRARRRAKKSSS